MYFLPFFQSLLIEFLPSEWSVLYLIFSYFCFVFKHVN